MTRGAAERGAAHPHPGAGWGRRGGGPAGGGRAQRGGGAAEGGPAPPPPGPGIPAAPGPGAAPAPRPPRRARWGPRGGKFILLRPPPAPRPAAPDRSPSGHGRRSASPPLVLGGGAGQSLSSLTVEPRGRLPEPAGSPRFSPPGGPPPAERPRAEGPRVTPPPSAPGRGPAQHPRPQQSLPSYSCPCTPRSQEGGVSVPVASDALHIPLPFTFCDPDPPLVEGSVSSSHPLWNLLVPLHTIY